MNSAAASTNHCRRLPKRIPQTTSGSSLLQNFDRSKSASYAAAAAAFESAAAAAAAACEAAAADVDSTFADAAVRTAEEEGCSP